MDVEQHKSSDYISRGLPPQGKSVLKLGKKTKPPKNTIWAEYQKATTAAHKTFYSNNKSRECTVTFAILSNKPLVDLNGIKENPDKLPPDTLVICYENFQQYCSSMCTRAIFVSKVFPPLLFFSLQFINELIG